MERQGTAAPRRPSGFVPAHNPGFTLVEMLVVLTIVSLLLTVVPPFFAAGIASTSLKGAALQIADNLRFTRSLAVTRQQETVLALDVENNSFHVSATQRVIRLPNSLSLSLITAASEQLAKGQGTIRFYPDGSSTGGRVTVAQGGRAYRVDVDWLSGKVTVLD